MKTKVYEGAKVMSSKNGKGEIVKIITRSTGYVEVRWENGKVSKEMAFNLTDEAGEALKSKPTVKAKVDSRTPQQRMADEIIELAKVSRIYNQSFFEIAFNKLGRLLVSVKQTNGFAAQVAASVESTMNVYGSQVASCSSKQAWIIACAAVENGINL